MTKSGHAMLWLMAGGLVLGGFHYADVSARRGALQRIVLDRGEGAAFIRHRYGVAFSHCLTVPRRDLDHLAAALVTTETLATPRIETWLRSSLTVVAARLNLPLDISMGPGRIRPSTARAVLSADDAEPLSDIDIAGKLLHPCGALAVAVAVTEALAGEAGGGPLDRDRVRRVAAKFNGQSWPASSREARLSHELYLDLVYNLYQDYRFGDADD